MVVLYTGATQSYVMPTRLLYALVRLICTVGAIGRVYGYASNRAARSYTNSSTGLSVAGFAYGARRTRPQERPDRSGVVPPTWNGASARIARVCWPGQYRADQRYRSGPCAERCATVLARALSYLRTLRAGQGVGHAALSALLAAWYSRHWSCRSFKVTAPSVIVRIASAVVGETKVSPRSIFESWDTCTPICAATGACFRSLEIRQSSSRMTTNCRTTQL